LLGYGNHCGGSVREKGTCGLVLSIVDWIVRLHHGSITVESQEEQGSTFAVTLPLALS
jgi:signal transduction histidine kinase